MKIETKPQASPMLPPLKALIAGGLTVIFMLYAVFESAVYACLIIALFLVCVYKATPKGSGFALSAVLTAIAFFLLGASVQALAYILSIISTAALGGIMLTNLKSGIIFTVFVGAVYAVAALLSSPAQAIPSLIGVPMAVAVAICTRLKAPRTAAVCAISGAFLATLILPAAIGLYLEHGSETAEYIKLFFDNLRAAQSEILVSAINTLVSANSPELSEAFDSQTISALADTVISLLPAVVIIISNAAALSVHTISIRARETLGDLPERNEKQLALSKVSAWLYIISFIAIFIGGAESDAARAMVLSLQNINLILTPSFLLVGISSISLIVRAGGGKRNPLHTLILVLAILYCGTLLLYPIVALGVIRTINSGKAPHKTQSP